MRPYWNVNKQHLEVKVISIGRNLKWYAICLTKLTHNATQFLSQNMKLNPTNFLGGLESYYNLNRIEFESHEVCSFVYVKFPIPKSNKIQFNFKIFRFLCFTCALLFNTYFCFPKFVRAWSCQISPIEWIHVYATWLGNISYACYPSLKTMMKSSFFK